MDLPIKFAEYVMTSLEEAIKDKYPVVLTGNGELFLHPTLPVGAIKLRIDLEDYLKFIRMLPISIKPKAFHTIPVTGQSFQIAVYARMEIIDREVYINKRRVVLI